jgi:hypothetical protein
VLAAVEAGQLPLTPTLFEALFEADHALCIWLLQLLFHLRLLLVFHLFLRVVKGLLAEIDGLLEISKQRCFCGLLEASSERVVAVDVPLSKAVIHAAHRGPTHLVGRIDNDVERASLALLQAEAKEACSRGSRSRDVLHESG